MSHVELEQLAAGYVLGALEPDDEHAFTEHLPGCAACQTTVRQFEGVIGQLDRGAPAVEPPRALRVGLRRKVGLSRARRGVLAFRPRVSGTVVARVALLAGALLLLALSFWNLTLRNQTAYYAQFQQVARLVNDPDARRVRLGDPDGGPGRATVITVHQRDEGVLLVEELPPLSEGRVYQLWALPPGGDLHAGAATPGRVWLASSELLPLRLDGMDLDADNQFAVTVEPTGGSTLPTSQPVLVTQPTGNPDPR